MALTDDDLQDLLQQTENGARFVYCVDPISGLDSQTGKNFRAGVAKQTIDACITDAAANFANKPIAIRFNGPIDKSGSLLNFQTTGLGPGVLRGIGRYASISGSLANGPTIRVGNNWEYADFRIISTSGADAYNYLIGDATSSITGVVMRRMTLEGTTDGTYFVGAGSSYDVFDSLLKSNWDNFYNQGNITARFWRCMMQTIGPHGISGATAHVQGCGQSISNAITHLYECAISLRATNSDTLRTAYGIHTQSGGLAILHGGTSLVAEVPDGTLVDLEADAASEIRASSNASFNYARSLAGSAGKITLYPSTPNRTISITESAAA